MSFRDPSARMDKVYSGMVIDPTSELDAKMISHRAPVYAYAEREEISVMEIERRRGPLDAKELAPIKRREYGHVKLSGSAAIWLPKEVDMAISLEHLLQTYAKAKGK